jgi:soluble cytochrome b562
LAAQLAFHFCAIDFGECEEAKEAQKALRELAIKFHRAYECRRFLP